MYRIILLLTVYILTIRSFAQPYQNLFTDQTFNNKTIDQTRPVGVIDGAGAVTLTGAATYTIPIKCPPGTNGISPNLTIAYSSQAGSGILGMGWNIEGLSSISRVAKNLFHDGVVGPVENNNNDMLALDGNRLNLVSGIYGQAGSTYRLEVDNFSTITMFDNGSNRWFRLLTKDGTEMDYGGTSDSRFLTDDGSQVMIWRLNRIRDVNGNYMEFKYTSWLYSRQTLIDKILYTGNTNTGLLPYNEISFSYTLSSQPNTVYEGGASIDMKAIIQAINIKGENSQAFKTYQINYGHNNICSFLNEVIEKDANGNMLNSTIFKYGDQPNALFENGLSLNNLPAKYTMFSGDFDGDGIQEVVTTEKLTGAGNYTYAGDMTILKRNSSGNYDVAQTIPHGNNSYITYKKREYPENSFGQRKTDFNGDGMEDILTFKTTFNPAMNWHVLDKFSIHYGNATSVINTSPVDITPSLIDYSGNSINTFITKPHLHESFFIGDFDGDKRSDILAMSCGPNWPHFLFIYEQGTIPQPVSSINFQQLNIHEFKSEVIDFDGDGKSELVLFGDQHHYIYSFVKQPNGKFNAVQIYSSGYPTAWHDSYPGDFNGDGKTDFLTCTGNGTLWEIALSTGKQFNVSTLNFNHHPVRPSTSSNYDRIVLADYNGDGKTDIFQAYDDPNSSVDKISVYYSKGIGFSREDFTGNNMLAMFTTGDINGDGRADLLKQKDIYAAPGSIFLKENGKENLLIKVKDGLGRVTEFGYSLLSNGGSFYSAGTASTYPLQSIKPGIYMVSSLSTSDGVGGLTTNSYSYEQAVLHLTARGFLGFKKITSVNNASDVKAESLFDINTYYYSAYKTEDNTYLASTGQQLSHNSYNFNFQSTIGTSFYQQLTSSSATNSLTGAVTTTTNTYNNNGSITQQVVNVNNIEQTATSTLYTITANGLEKPLSVTVSRKRLTEPFVFDMTTFTYDALGRLKMKTDFANKQQKVITSYNYNTFGNLIDETVSGTAIPYTATTTYEYDAKGRFPVKVKNPLNQESTTTWHPLWGKPIETTGIDDVKTTNVYDSWGKLTSSTIKYWNTITAYTVTYSDGWDLNSGVWYTNTTHPGRPDVKIWYDLLGREIKTETEHYNNQKVYTVKTYNNKGQCSTSAKPYLLSESPIATTYTYNAYGLLASTSDVYGTTNYTYAYGNGKTTTTVSSPKGMTKTVTDAAGKVLEQEDNGGKLTYTYDSRGNVLTVKHGAVVLVANTYDAYGRKISMNDCDAGVTTYTYDAWGRLLSEKDAKANTHTFTYDNMSRVTTRVGPEGTTTYGYYGVGSGKANQLQTITGFNGVDEEFDYDQFGRMNYHKTSLDSKDFTTNYTYNFYGDVITVNYNTGFGYTNNYDANGFLQNVQTNWYGFPYYSSETLFTIGVINGQGQYTSYVLGNGKTTTKTYNNGFPLTTSTPNVQDLVTSFDIQTGNLIYRKDNRANYQEDFTYDNLNRLTSSTVSYFGNPGYVANPYQIISYDQHSVGSRGNIIAKSDVGNYQYGGFPRHAVKYVDNTPHNISAMQQDISYTPFRKAEKVTENGFEQAFTYDAAYDRVKSEVIQNGNLQQRRYYLDGYEYNVVGNTYIYYIPGGDGICAIVEHCPSISAPVKAIHYVYTDHLGSILTVTDASGAIEAEQSFDAWGRFRDPHDWLNYNVAPALHSWLYRGYTGHEHMPEFTLINMNGRMYDPLLGRMLSPDILTHGGTQGYNRFSYCHNNPLSYVDPDGNNPLIVAVAVGAAIGAASYTYSVAVSPGGFKNWDWGSFAFGTFSGAFSGAITWGIGSAFQAAGGAFLGGTVGQELGRAAVHGYFGYINGAMSGNAEAGFWSAAASSLAGSIGAHIPILNTDGGGALMSAAIGGIVSEINGGSFIEGTFQGLMVQMLNHNLHKQGEAKQGDVEAQDLLEHGAGPGLVQLGQPIRALKPYGYLGSKQGSSIASYTLSKTIPATFTKTFGKKAGVSITKVVGTNVIGRALGRLVPYAGWGLTLGDVWVNRAAIWQFTKNFHYSGQQFYRNNPNYFPR